MKFRHVTYKYSSWVAFSVGKLLAIPHTFGAANQSPKTSCKLSSTIAIEQPALAFLKLLDTKAMHQTHLFAQVLRQRVYRFLDSRRRRLGFALYAWALRLRP